MDKKYSWVAHKLVGGPEDGRRTCLAEGDLYRRNGSLYRRTDEHVIEGSFKLRIWRFVDEQAIDYMDSGKPFERHDWKQSDSK